MKRFSFIIALLLGSTIQLLAQARLTSNIETYDLGQVEWNKPVTVDYTITNTGDMPLYLSNVSTSCACNVASWTQDFIEPNQKGRISVTFDAKAMGKFYKEVAVYSNSVPEIVYLSFVGEVVREVTDHSRTHPFQIGGVRMNLDSLNFGDVQYGDKVSLVLGIANETSNPLAPILMHAPSYLEVKPSEMFIQKSGTGLIEVVFDSSKWSEFGDYNSEVYLSRFIGDKVGAENKIPISFTVLPSEKNISKNRNVINPKTSLSKTKVDLRTANHSKKHKEQIILTNTGQSNLYVYKVQTFSPAVRVDLASGSIRKGESAKLKVTYDFSKMANANDDLSILLITNEPTTPKLYIRAQK